MGLRLIAAATAIAWTAPAPAEDTGGWTLQNGLITVDSARISLPVRAGTLSLTQAGEASRRGEGVDNAATYRSESGDIVGSVFVFYAAYANAALASFATDTAIHALLGPQVALTSETIVRAGGAPRSAIRRVYEKGSFSNGAPVTTLAAFLRAGRWIVAMRVTGKAEDRAGAEADLDALLSGIRFPGRKPNEAFKLNVVGPCAESDGKAANPLPAKSEEDGLAASMLAGLGGLPAPAAALAAGASLPESAAGAFCSSGTLGSGTRSPPVLHSADASAPQRVIIPFNDAGGVLAVEPATLSDGYQVKLYNLGYIDLLGTYESVPNKAQLAAILDGSDRNGAAVRSRTTIGFDGQVTISVNTDAPK